MNQFAWADKAGKATPGFLPLEANSACANYLRVLVFTEEAERAAFCAALRQEDHAFTPCADAAQLCREIETGAGLAIVDEALLDELAWTALSQVLAGQPVWSDFPLVVLTAGEQTGTHSEFLDDPMVNALLLERPVKLPGLMSVVRAELRSRRRQCEMHARFLKGAPRREALRAQEDLEREKNFSELAINSLPGVFYALDDRGHLLRWNKALEQVTGYSSEEIPRMHALQFFAPEHQALIAERIAEVFRNGQSTADAPLLTKSGGQIPYFFNGVRCHLGDGLGLIGLGVDVTEQKRTEQRLREAHDRLSRHAEELEKRVDERTRNLQASIQSLEGVLYHVAHDLRAPLRTMQGFTTILLEECSALGEEGVDYARRIAEASSRMDKLIQDLLAYGRMAHVALKPARLDLNQQVQDILGHFSQEIMERNAVVQVESPLMPVTADEGVLAQLLVHLVNNALTFVAKGETPRIHIYTERLNQAMVRLSIQDNGIGIAEEHHERIFRVFERLQTEGVTNGTAIGLAIVRKGAERMGGAAGLDSKPGSGSRFWLDLPAA